MNSRSLCCRVVLGISFLLFCLLSLSFSQSTLSWFKHIPGPYISDQAMRVCVANDGTVYASGMMSGSITLTDIFTMKLTSAGDTLWTRTYTTPGGGWENAKSMAIDDSGCAYVIGTVGDRLTVLKYSSDGTLRWVRKYLPAGATSSSGTAIAVSRSGAVYATGVASATVSGDNVLTVAYSSNGDTLWARSTDGGLNKGDSPAAIAVDKNSNCVVTGQSDGVTTNMDMFTVRYLSTGDTSWTRHYNAPSNGQDYGYAVAVDTSGNVFVAGETYTSGKGDDACLVSYAPSGTLRFAKTYSGPGANLDRAYAIAVCPDQSIVLTGSTELSSGSGYYLTVRYLATGDTSWARWYRPPGTIYGNAFALAIATNGSVYITGEVWGGAGRDMCTVKYSATGDTVWTKRHNGPGNEDDFGTSIALASVGGVVVGGASCEDVTSTDFAVWYYQESTTGVGPATDRIPETYALDQNYPNPFNPRTVVSYQLSVVSRADLRVYDLLGREVAVLVNEVKPPGTYSVTWNASGMASGVYFYQLRAGGQVMTKKMILLK